MLIATEINKKAPPVGEAQYMQMTSWFFRKDSRLSKDRQILMVLMIKKAASRETALTAYPIYDLATFMWQDQHVQSSIIALSG